MFFFFWPVLFEVSFVSFFYWALIAIAFAGAIHAARNPNLSQKAKIGWVLANLIIPCNAIVYYMVYSKKRSLSQGYSFIGQHVSSRFLYHLSVVSVLAFIPIASIATLLAEYNSKDFLKDHAYSYWAKNFDESNAQVVAKTISQYDAILNKNKENAFTYYRRGQLKERNKDDSGRSDFQVSLRIIIDSLEKEDDPKRLQMLEKLKGEVEAELNRK